jgi:hypothetical protein
MKMRRDLLTLTGLLFLFVTTPLGVSATSIYANGGSYFEAQGPNYYWRYDWNEGYCGKYGSWCSPRHFQWTWNNRGGMSPVNSARWKAVPVNYYSRAYAFIPRRNATTRNAPYTVSYGYVSTRTSYVNQMAYYDQWVPLAWGESLYRISGVELNDLTFEPRWTRIAFDEIKIEN